MAAAVWLDAGDAGDAGEDINACVARLFPPASFDFEKTDLTLVCTERYPHQAITQIQSRIALHEWGRGGATDGMREWAIIGWYDLAALAVFRGHCCAKPVQLLWTFQLACPLDAAMSHIEQGVRDRDEALLARGVGEYTRAARCLARLGQGRNFGHKGMPGAGLQTFDKTLKRLRQQWAKP